MRITWIRMWCTCVCVLVASNVWRAMHSSYSLHWKWRWLRCICVLWLKLAFARNFHLYASCFFIRTLINARSTWIRLIVIDHWANEKSLNETEWNFDFTPSFTKYESVERPIEAKPMHIQANSHGLAMVWKMIGVTSLALVYRWHHSIKRYRVNMPPNSYISTILNSLTT